VTACAKCDIGSRKAKFNIFFMSVVILYTAVILPVKRVHTNLQSACDLDVNADTCTLHTTCKPACIPKFCKIHNNPNKIHGHGHDGGDDDRYVKLGAICGFMKYVDGEPNKGRHAVEVCCEVDDDYSRETCQWTTIWTMASVLPVTTVSFRKRSMTCAGTYSLLF
jgi:hypothetical protein